MPFASRILFISERDEMPVMSMDETPAESTIIHFIILS